MQNNKNKSIAITLHKAQLQMDQFPHQKPHTINQTEEKIGFFNLIGIRKISSEEDIDSIDIKSNH